MGGDRALWVTLGWVWGKTLGIWVGLAGEGGWLFRGDPLVFGGVRGWWPSPFPPLEEGAGECATLHKHGGRGQQGVGQSTCEGHLPRR